MKKVFFFHSLILLLIAGCNDLNLSSTSKSDIDSDLYKMLQSTRFFNSHEEIDYRFDKSETFELKEGVFASLIPVSPKVPRESRTELLESYIIPVYDENSNLQFGIYMENYGNHTVTQQAPDFSGQLDLILFNEEDEERSQLVFENGSIVENSSIEDLNNGRIECCGCSLRGVSECVGYKFEENFITAEEVTCYIGFALCITARYIDCYKQEC